MNQKGKEFQEPRAQRHEEGKEKCKIYPYSKHQSFLKRKYLSKQIGKDQNN